MTRARADRRASRSLAYAQRSGLSRASPKLRAASLATCRKQHGTARQGMRADAGLMLPSWSGHARQ